MARMTIGEFARASGLSAKALRLYDDLGLVPPASVDESNGYRYYEPGQLDRARLVARLRLIGLPLERIRAVADLPPESRPAELTSYWRQVEADHASRRSQVTALVEEQTDKESSMRIDIALVVDAAARSGIGHREAQLDALYAGRRLFAVADGFGPSPTAAAGVVAVIAEYDDLQGAVDPVKLADEAVARAVDTVADQPGSGCTLTALFVGDDQVAIAHIGDSRAYLVRDGRLQRVTRDHTLVQLLVDEGRLTEEEARGHDDRLLINRAIAPDSPSTAPDISVLSAQPGDRFALTTDGVHSVLSSAELADLVTHDAPSQQIAADVERAVADAGAPDNYSVVVVDLP